MPPRKPAAAGSDDNATDPPRRSGRIASQPTTTTTTTEARPAKVTKKRTADEGKETSSTKKSKLDPESTEEAAAGSSSSNALPSIDIGGSLPELTLKNEKGEDIQVADLASEKGVIIFLVPKADTPGCTNQACGFRDSYPDFTSLNFDVYCLSADTSTAQSKWQTKKELPYPLISDPKRILITALGAGEGGKTKRSHFIFEKGGKLVNKKLPVTPADSPKLALEFVKSL